MLGNTKGGNPDDLFFVTLQCCITGSIQHFRLNFDLAFPALWMGAGFKGYCCNQPIRDELSS